MRDADVFALRIGDSASRTRTFGREDMAEYRSLSGDSGLRFGSGEAGVPGPLLAGMISDLLGTRLPGLGTQWMKQSLEYAGTASIGAEVVATVTIVRMVPEKGLVYLYSSCRCRGTTVASGRTLVLVGNLADRIVPA